MQIYLRQLHERLNSVLDYFQKNRCSTVSHNNIHRIGCPFKSARYRFLLIICYMKKLFLISTSTASIMKNKIFRYQFLNLCPSYGEKCKYCSRVEYIYFLLYTIDKLYNEMLILNANNCQMSNLYISTVKDRFCYIN